MHNSFEQNDDKETIRNALTRHYEEYHPENLDHIDIELKKQLAKTGSDMGGGSNSQESRAKENTGDFWWGKHVTWESGFDQDFLYCNYSKRDMYAPASYWEPLNYIGDDKMNKFIPDHLKQHGITEPTVTFAGLTESKKVNKHRRGF